MTITKLEIAKIRLDNGTQMREALDQNAVDEYAAAMIAGDQFPPVRVFNYGDVYWLTDGFHRIAAAKKIGYVMIEADIQLGGLRDAIIDSTAANAKHGLRRSREATRRSIETLLKDEEWGIKSDSQIAKKVGCDHKTVGARRAEMEASGEIPKMETRLVERNGVQYEMKSAVKPEQTITNQGITFQVGDVVSFTPDLKSWYSKMGRITAIDGEQFTLELVISSRITKGEQPETCTTTSRVRKVSDTEYVRWHNYALFDAQTITLYPWKDHFISLDAPYKATLSRQIDGYNWKPTESWDVGLAWRFDASYLDQWRENGINFLVFTEDLLSERMKMILGKVGRARGGEINKPPQPAPEAVQPTLTDDKINPGQPNKEPIERGSAIPAPRWVRVGTKVKHISGKICEIQSAYVSEKVWMLRVEVIKPEEGFANAPVSEFDPILKPGNRMLHYGEMVELTSYQYGTSIDVRGVLSGKDFGVAVDRLKEISESVENGRQYRLKTNGNNVRVIAVQKDNLTAMIYDLVGKETLAGLVHEYTVLISELEPFQAEEKTVIQATPAAEPDHAINSIFNDEQLDALQASLQRMFTFLELRLIPDDSDFLNDLENVYQAMHTARAEYRKLLDPATGEVKA